MKISDFLSPADTMVDVRASDKRELLRELSRKAALALKLPTEHVASELLKREELGSTGMGSGVAIPHARIGAVTKPFGILVKLKQPIDFDAIDGEPVDLIFLLLLAISPQGQQLDALATVARKLRAPATVARMRQAKESAELYSAFSD
jgi:PTS system nitrogen regulatory IIA component